MSSFSTIACYAALKSSLQQDLVLAYARMVVALVQEKRYSFCNIHEIMSDFEETYGFPVSYHPMRTIMDECIKVGYFTYNSSTHQCLPNYSEIDKEEFMEIVKEKESRYELLLNQFKEFLQKTHSLYVSKEDLNERILAFVERFGIKTNADRSIIHKIKDDYFVAEFLVYCEENGCPEVIDCLDEFTVGMSLSEIFTYSERPEAYTAKDAQVYLDTALLFRILGIDSAGNADSYKTFLENMRTQGMHIKTYEHTVNELIGIIEASKIWIGNPDYDATKCSEATYYFVTNNWEKEDVDEFSGRIRDLLQDEYGITIDKTPYPKVEDIHTPFEADIREIIEGIYKEANPDVDLEELKYTIDQDAKSIFLTQHKNGRIVPYHVNDIKNIFITTNKSLAKVGYRLSYQMAVAKEYFIPVVMSDIKWGTLIWFNSPGIISSLNRPRLVSAAYAAFRPSPEVVQRLNRSLKELEETGTITPEQCYFLKTSPIAQKLLAKKTVNDPTRFVDSTPLEILKELTQEAFNSGSFSRQGEIDILKSGQEQLRLELAIVRQEAIISAAERDVERAEGALQKNQERKAALEDELDECNCLRSEIDEVVACKIKWIKICITVVAILLIAPAVYIGKKWSWITGVLSLGVPSLLAIVALWNNENVSLLSLIPKIERKIQKKQNVLRRYSPEKVVALEKELSEIKEKENGLQNNLNEAKAILKRERAKIDPKSIDISIM